MSQDDAELIARLVDQFYRDFQEMVTITMRKVRPDLRRSLAERLQEKSSIYGVEWP